MGQGSETGSAAKDANHQRALPPALAEAWGPVIAAVRLVSGWFLDKPFMMVIPLVLLFTFVKSGLGIFPALGIEMDVTQALPYAPVLPPGGEYFMSSLMGPLLVRLLGLQGSIVGYLAVHALAIVLAIASVIAAVFRKRGDRAARFATVALCTSAVPVILLQWVGSFDVFTFWISALLVVVESWPALLVLSVLLGMQHAEQSIVIVGLLVLAGANRRWRRPQLAGLLIGGVLLGRVIMALYHTVIGIGLFSGTASVVNTGLGSWDKVVTAYASLPTLLYSSLGGAWFWILPLFVIFARYWRDRATLAAALALPFALTFVVGDQTRVYAMVTAPVLLWIALAATERLDREQIEILVAAAIMGLVVAPALFIWGTVLVPVYDQLRVQ